jgi:parallel beta-helix repeat protein
MGAFVSIVDANTYQVLKKIYGIYAGMVSGRLALPDFDGDGSPADVDCDDNDDTIYPGAPELCDCEDNNCDGYVDEGVCGSTSYYYCLINAYTFNESEGNLLQSYYGDMKNAIGQNVSQGAAGINGDAYYFDSIDTYVDLGFDVYNNVDEFAKRGTFSFWFKMDGKYDDDQILSYFPGNLRVEFKVDDHIIRASIEQPGDNFFLLGTYLPEDNDWHHVVLTWSIDTDNVSWYVDGSLVDSTADFIGDSIDFDQWDGDVHGQWALGAENGEPSIVNFKGTMDELYMWERALTPDEAIALYNGGNGRFFPFSCVVPTDGMVLTKDTTFCTGTYNLPNGINIGADNVVLDCNEAVIEGDRTQKGIQTNNVEVIIKNCVIKNFTTGIKSNGGNNRIQNNIISKSSYFAIGVGNNNSILNNELRDNKNGIDVYRLSGYVIEGNTINNSEVYGILLDKSNNGVIMGNIISNCGWNNDYTYRAGISLAYTSNENNISNNTLINNQPYNLWLRGRAPDELPSQNRIWGNNFYTTNIHDENEPNNIYCINCVGNNYYDGATGPTCPTSCLDQDNDGIPNSEDKCPNTVEEQIIYGCSCRQILEKKPGEDTATNREGCSKGIVDVFTKAVGWAKDLFE